MKRLPEKLFQFLLYISKSNDKIEITHDNGYLNIDDFTYEMERLENSGLIEILSCFIDYKNGYFEDFFLGKFSKLVGQGNISEAKKFAKANNISEIFDTANKEFKSINELSVVLAQVYKKLETSAEEFGQEIDYNTQITFIKTPKLREYITEYTNSFKDDLLEDDRPVNDELFGKRTEYFRYKKQKNLILNLIKTKLETESPKKISITYEDISAFRDNINLPEILESLVSENFINSYDTEDHRRILLDVNEQKSLDYYVAQTKEATGTVNFDTDMSTLYVKGKEYKIKKYENIYYILEFIFKQKFGETILYDQISDELEDTKHISNKSINNAIYQLKITRLAKDGYGDLFLTSMKSVVLNTKYF